MSNDDSQLGMPRLPTPIATSRTLWLVKFVHTVVWSFFAACIVALPLLTLAASFFGVFMGWVTATLTEPISLQRFINSGFNGAGFKDFLPPTFKTCVYGAIIGTISCFQGMRAKGGAVGVGSAATTSVVLSSLFVILADVILVKLILLLFN